MPRPSASSYKPVRSVRSAQAVLEAIDALHHPTAQEALDWLKAKETGKVSLTSVYRALNQLVAKTQIKPLHFFNDGQVRYERIHAGDEHHHHHLICTRCNRVQLLDGCFFEAALKQIEPDFTVQYHNFEVFGLCATCR